MAVWHKWSALLGILFVFLLSPFESRAINREYVNLPMPAEFVAAKNQDGSTASISAAAIEKSFREASPPLHGFYHNKQISSYIVPEQAWLDSLLGVFKEYLAQVGIQWRPENWDCDNYSQLLNSFATVRLWRAGYTKDGLAMGWLVVDGKRAWAGVPASRHALLFAATSHGVVIIEPQNGQTIALNNYPNKGAIKEVFLF